MTQTSQVRKYFTSTSSLFWNLHVLRSSLEANECFFIVCLPLPRIFYYSDTKIRSEIISGVRSFLLSLGINGATVFPQNVRKCNQAGCSDRDQSASYSPLASPLFRIVFLLTLGDFHKPLIALVSREVSSLWKAPFQMRFNIKSWHLFTYWTHLTKVSLHIYNL